MYFFSFEHMYINPMKPVLDLFRLEQEIQRAKLRGNLALAIQLYDQIIAIKQQLPNNKLGLAKSIAEKGFTLEQCGFHREALRSYQAASEIAQGSPNIDFCRTIETHIQTLSKQFAF